MERHRDGSASESRLRDRINGGAFAVALSGGGHRATLATLGALLALVDRGLAPKILQVASVSGGSITNAFVAQRAHLEALGPEGLDDIATELATTIVRKGALTGRWIVVTILTPVVVGIAAGVLLRRTIVPWTWLTVAIGTAIAVAGLLGRGLVVDWLLDRRYFRRKRLIGARTRRERAKFASLSGRQIDHVLCATDLALGLPVYASTQHGGVIWRRLGTERRSPWASLPFQTFDARELSIAELVRASAGFPGIPPRRLRIPSDPDNPFTAGTPSVAFLADGGIWNNLGSQVIREDGFIGDHMAWDRGVVRPYGLVPKDIPLFCFNGSAPLRPAHPWVFRIPGVALFSSLMQAMNILNANTVIPRVAGMTASVQRRAWSGRRPHYLDPADLVADLRPTDRLADDYRECAWGAEQIRATDPSVIEWEQGTSRRAGLARAHRRPDNEIDETDWLAYVLGAKAPEGSFPVCGLASFDDWEALRTSPDWKRLVANEGSGPVGAATTLGRFEVELARRLIARAYLNTYLVSIFLAPLVEGDLERLARLPQRLDKIVGRV